MKANNAQKLLKIITIVLALLLVVSLALLAWTFHAYKNASAAATAPGNVISPGNDGLSRGVYTRASLLADRTVVDRAKSGSTVLELYRDHADESTPFQVENMFPGDTERKTELLRVTYTGSITVHFHADIQPGYEKLAEVLGCRVTVEGTQLYDGLMRDMPASIDYRLPQSSGGTAELTYQIDAYLDTSVGNDYMAKSLKADFVWWVDASEGGSDRPVGPDHPDRPSGPDKPSQPGKPTPGNTPDTPDQPEGELLPSPDTGDDSHILLWVALFVLALLVLVLLLLTRKRKKEARDENEA